MLEAMNTPAQKTRGRAHRTTAVITITAASCLVLIGAALCGTRTFLLPQGANFFNGQPPALSANAAAVRIVFNDSSVPPRYHRSYILEADAQAAHIVVRSYAAQVADRSVALDPQLVTTALREHRAAFAGLRSSRLPVDACPGGTSYTVEVWNRSKQVFSGISGGCGDRDKENRHAIGQFADEFIAPLGGSSIFQVGREITPDAVNNPIGTVPSGCPHPHAPGQS